jgi:hypothetical protein
MMLEALLLFLIHHYKILEKSMCLKKSSSDTNYDLFYYSFAPTVEEKWIRGGSNPFESIFDFKVFLSH